MVRQGRRLGQTLCEFSLVPCSRGPLLLPARFPPFWSKTGTRTGTRTINVIIRQKTRIVRPVYIRHSAVPACNTPSSGPGSSVVSQLAKPNQAASGKVAIVATQKTKKMRKQDQMHYCDTGSEPELFIYRQHPSPPSLIPPLTVKLGISAEEPILLAC